MNRTQRVKKNLHCFSFVSKFVLGVLFFFFLLFSGFERFVSENVFDLLEEKERERVLCCC